MADTSGAAPAHQSLYRRYRSQRFSELVGQDHVVRALRNAVAHNTTGHAYLFSGPRGTGKTSTARILAKALNCTDLHEGEPCGVCPSCVAITEGTSFDVHELDAASNNGVDAIRDLIERTALGSPGRTKVYILDEVHMLSKQAEAALLKTLEEPPSHVVFVLATTDPQKVSATIRSRCQPFEFHLLPSDELEQHVRFVIADAHLEVNEDAIEAVMRQGAGSARDTLSALDQVAASGGVVVDSVSPDDLAEALIERDTAAALTAVAQAVAAGRDARALTEALVSHLRDMFLALQAPSLLQLPDTAVARVTDQAKRYGAAAVVRAMEVLGELLVELRHAPDPRLLLDVSLVRLTNANLDTSSASLLERIERLEHGIPPTPIDVPTTSAPVSPTPAAIAAAPSSGPKAARAALGALKGNAAPEAPKVKAPRPAPTADTATPDVSTTPAVAPATTPDDAPAPTAKPPTPTGGAPTLDMLQLAWNEAILPKLKGVASAMYRAGHFVSLEGGAAQYALPNAVHRDRCEGHRADAEAALAAHFGAPIRLLLVVDGQAGNPSPARGSSHAEESIDPSELVNAPPGDAPTGIDRLTAAFPGAQLLEE
jgi:DNA polymerase-3 subunit gamma/tau